MTETGIKNPKHNLSSYGFRNLSKVNWNWSQDELIDETVHRGMGKIVDGGALAVDTGEFTGRAPKDKYFIKDSKTADTIYWGDVNQPLDEKYFQPMVDELLNYFEGKEVYVKDAYACADPKYRLNVRVISELPWAAFFSGNMFFKTEERRTHFH
jgi:phosphoenolpyruvate carboxykinase (ATP)